MFARLFIIVLSIQLGCSNNIEFETAKSYHNAVRAYDMKEGRWFNKNKLIVSKFTQLVTVTPEEEPHILVGSSLAGYSGRPKVAFNFIMGFVELRNDSIVVVDRRNHCLRSVDLETGDVSTFAGICQDAGFQDGELLNSNFNKPSKVVGGLYRGEYYVTDTYNDAVRIIKKEDASVETVIKGISRPNAIAVDYKKKCLLVTCSAGVAVINLDQPPVVYLTDYELNGAVEVFGESLAIVTLMPEVYVVGDYTKKRVFMLDRRNNQSVATIIANESVYSVALSNQRDKLYLGLAESIKYVPVKGLQTELQPPQLPPRPTTTTTTTSSTNAGRSYPLSDDAMCSTGVDMTSWSTHLVIGQGAFITFLLAVVVVLLFKQSRLRNNRGRLDYDVSIPSDCPPSPPGGGNRPDQNGYEQVRHVSHDGGLEEISTGLAPSTLGRQVAQARPTSVSASSQSAAYEPVGPPELARLTEA